VGYTTLRAPATEPDALYTIARRWVDPGAFLQPGSGGQKESLLTVMRVDKLRVSLYVPELDAARVTRGDRAGFQTAALGNRQFEGRVSRISSALDPQTRTMRVEIDFANADGKPLYPGMYGSTTATLGEQQDIWMIPSAYLHKEDGKPFVNT